MFTFKGGVHPKEQKITAKKNIEKAKLPKRVIILLKQHVGGPCKPVVQVGDIVKTGQLVGQPEGLGANIHSSITGKVVKVEDFESSVFGKVPSITVEEEGEEEIIRLEEKEPIEMVKDAGVVGMGGAMFPTAVKLSPPKTIDHLIINAAECEPYLTCDYRLMVEKQKEVDEGVSIIKDILNVKKVIVGVEENKKPVQIKHVKYLKTKYPQGAEKTLIKALLNRETPPKGLPFDVGCIVSNVGTAVAVYEAVKEKKPLYERVVTVTGDVKEPKNILARVGTPVKELIEECGGFKGKPAKILNGGPMMGIVITEEDPLLKGTSGIVVMNEDTVEEYAESNCIRCSRCIDACPMKLMPKVFADLVKNKRYKELECYNIADCVECGACTFSCPAKIPIVKYIREGKAKCR